MSAVPKKKLCWNCEGNVPKDLDNCPYCAVYLHGLDEDNNSSWTSSRYSEEEIPEPLYQRQEDAHAENEESEASPLTLSISFQQLKKDVFPALFLMAGSVFFLFGIILFLFAYDGVLTLQWQGHYAPYFLLASAPLIFLGWKYLQRLED
ncbi:MAG: hypothetical protein H0V82_06145 [Candidatus Protochlamydia sp.]|nr:hypothetical protein [Candidatus Protochlamydia sp.]